MSEAPAALAGSASCAVEQPMYAERACVVSSRTIFAALSKQATVAMKGFEPFRVSRLSKSFTKVFKSGLNFVKARR